MATVTAIDKTQSKRNAPPPPPPGSDQPRDDWQTFLRVNKHGDFIADELNVMIALKFAPEFSGLLGYDDAWKVVVALRQTPFAMKEVPPCWWTDECVTMLQAWLIHAGFTRPSQRTVERCVNAVAILHSFRRVQDYLNAITWDGRPRVDGLLNDYFGVKDSVYVRAASRCFMIGAAARALEPGCKCDTVLVLEGLQGLRKSTALETLAGHDFFTDNIAQFGSRDASDQVHGMWFIELPEIERIIRGAGSSKAKAFASTKKDYYRPAFARYKRLTPRDSIMVGTTNRQQYLIDSTGNRRFVPVWCERADIDGLARDRDQLWGEAVSRYRNGEQWWFSESEETVAKVEQDARVERHPWVEIIGPYLDDLAAKREDVSIAEIFNGPLRDRDRTPTAEKTVVKILQAEGWIQSRPRKNNPDRVRRYRKS
jgi:putative DNA primase/helicase